MKIFKKILLTLAIPVFIFSFVMADLGYQPFTTIMIFVFGITLLFIVGYFVKEIWES